MHWYLQPILSYLKQIQWYLGQMVSYLRQIKSQIGQTQYVLDKFSHIFDKSGLNEEPIDTLEKLSKI